MFRNNTKLPYAIYSINLLKISIIFHTGVICPSRGGKYFCCRSLLGESKMVPTKEALPANTCI